MGGHIITPTTPVVRCVQDNGHELQHIGARGHNVGQARAQARKGARAAGAVHVRLIQYGAGGVHPTVTDANVVLGRINAERPIGGKLARLDTDAARAAILRDVGGPLGLDAMAAAEAILRVANARMAGALRLLQGRQ